MLDLDAIVSTEDPDREPYIFKFANQVWELPPQMDMRALMLMSREDVDGAMTALMGAEQYDRFLKASGGVLTPERFSALMKGYAAYQGADDMGESLASSPSSAGTGTPSKLTLPGITRSTSGAPSQRAS
jgi:hypothetical protein